MEGSSNGGMLYHEVQEGNLCAVHCVNTVLQGSFFSEFDLAAIASDLDRDERRVMDGGDAPAANFLLEDSHNVALDGNFSIQVLQKAMEVWNLKVIPIDSPSAGPGPVNPEMENAFICHLRDHWFSIRKVNGNWYNFDSLYAAPQQLSKFYLTAYLDSLKGFGWSIFLVRGNFPRECLMPSSDASNYGQWLTPEDARKITEPCHSKPIPLPLPPNRTRRSSSGSRMRPELLSDMEDENLKAAIAASLIDLESPSAVPSTQASTTTLSGSKDKMKRELPSDMEDKILKAAWMIHARMNPRPSEDKPELPLDMEDPILKAKMAAKRLEATMAARWVDVKPRTQVSTTTPSVSEDNKDKMKPELQVDMGDRILKARMAAGRIEARMGAKRTGAKMVAARQIDAELTSAVPCAQVSTTTPSESEDNKDKMKPELLSDVEDKNLKAASLLDSVSTSAVPCTEASTTTQSESQDSKDKIA